MSGDREEDRSGDRGGEGEPLENDEWEFSLEDVGPDAERHRTLEPQDVDPTNALFVALGAATAVGVILLLLL